MVADLPDPERLLPEADLPGEDEGDGRLDPVGLGGRRFDRGRVLALDHPRYSPGVLLSPILAHRLFVQWLNGRFDVVPCALEEVCLDPAVRLVGGWLCVGNLNVLARTSLWITALLHVVVGHSCNLYLFGASDLRSSAGADEISVLKADVLRNVGFFLLGVLYLYIIFLMGNIVIVGGEEGCGSPPHLREYKPENVVSVLSEGLTIPLNVRFLYNPILSFGRLLGVSS